MLLNKGLVHSALFDDGEELFLRKLFFPGYCLLLELFPKAKAKANEKDFNDIQKIRNAEFSGKKREKSIEVLVRRWKPMLAHSLIHGLLPCSSWYPLSA